MPDLDNLKQQWAAQGRALDAQLQLDVDAVRRRLVARTATAQDRQRMRRLWSLGFGAIALAALAAFAGAHLHDLPYLLLALPLAVITLAQFSVDLREWRSLGRLDFGQPLLALRTEYDRLRTRRVQMARAIALLAVLLWWPLLLVLAKGLLGLDLLRRLPFSVLAVNVALGVLLIPGIDGIARWVARRYPNSAALRRFVDDLAGADWRRSSDELDRQLAFEHEVTTHGAPQALRERRQPLPPSLQAMRRLLRRRLNAGFVLVSVLILSSGAFMAAHGGQASALAPGLLLHATLIGWLIGAIRHYDAVRSSDDETDPHGWGERLRKRLHARRVLLQSYVIATPLLSLALLQVLGLALARQDLLLSWGLAIWLGLGAVATIAIALLFQRWRRRGSTFAATVTQLMSLGTLDATATLAAMAARETNAETPRAAA